MTVYVTATTTRPTIVCPAWCERTDQHLEELAGWEGRAVHQKHVGAPRFGLTAGRTLCVDGTRDDNDETVVIIDGHDHTLEQALEVAQAIIDLVREITENV